MSNLSKYCLLLDPSNSGVEFIIRTYPPIIVGQVVRGDIEQMIRDYQPMAVGKPYEQNEWAVFYAGKIDAAPLIGTAQEQADHLAKIMRKMSDFYLHNYIEK